MPAKLMGEIDPVRGEGIRSPWYKYSVQLIVPLIRPPCALSKWKHIAQSNCPCTLHRVRRNRGLLNTIGSFGSWYSPPCGYSGACRGATLRSSARHIQHFAFTLHGHCFFTSSTLLVNRYYSVIH